MKPSKQVVFELYYILQNFITMLFPLKFYFRELKMYFQNINKTRMLFHNVKVLRTGV